MKGACTTIRTVVTGLLERLLFDDEPLVDHVGHLALQPARRARDRDALRACGRHWNKLRIMLYPEVLGAAPIECIPKKSLPLACFSSTLALTQGSQAECRHSMSLGVPGAKASGAQHSAQRAAEAAWRAGDASESAPSPSPLLPSPQLAPPPVLPDAPASTSP